MQFKRLLCLLIRVVVLIWILIHQMEAVLGGRPNHLTAADLLTLGDCKEHANAVLKIVDDLERTGNSEQALPKFPKAELLDILG